MGYLILPSFLCSCLVGLLLCHAVAVVVEVVAVGGDGAGCGRSRSDLRRGVGEGRVLIQRRYPCCCDVVKAVRSMKFDRRNSKSFVGEIELRPNNLELHFYEIWGDAL